MCRFITRVRSCPQGQLQDQEDTIADLRRQFGSQTAADGESWTRPPSQIFAGGFTPRLSGVINISPPYLSHRTNVVLRLGMVHLFFPIARSVFMTFACGCVVVMASFLSPGSEVSGKASRLAERSAAEPSEVRHVS